MGLLSDPHHRRRLVHVISKYHSVLSILCYVAGVVWFLALPYQDFNAKTYFSENALLPGLVDSHFHHDHGASGYLNNLREHVKVAKDNPSNSELRHRIPSDWFVKTFQGLGLETHVQNFTFTYPDGILKDQTFEGKNVFGILRAPRGASTESVVMSAPYRPPESTNEKTASGIALMMGLAKSCRKHSYWAKDIIFLVTEHERLGMQAFLEAYHYIPNKYIVAGELGGRAGSIQAAVNLEFPQDSIHGMNIKLEGLNGQLPNLDLVNTVVKLCRQEHIPVTLHKKMDYHVPLSWIGYEHALKTMLAMMWDQASCTPTGNHGLFHRFHIEAVTLQGVRIKNARKSFGFTETGRVVEGLFRSLNNLLERFHQSFFFYLLPATDRYVSIGLYMPPIGLLLLSIVIKALALWIKYAGIYSVPDGDNTTNDETDKKQTTSSKQDFYSSILPLLPPVILAGFFAYVAYGGTRFFIQSAEAFHLSPHEGMGVGALAVMIASMFFPYMLRRKIHNQGGELGTDWRLLKCLSLLACSAVLTSLALINVSLAFFIMLPWVPVLILIKPSTYRVFTILQGILLLLISPLGLLLAASFIHNTLHSTSSDPPLLTQLSEAWETARQGLLISFVDRAMLGSWMYPLMTLVLYPIWLLFWTLLWTSP